jgi:phosphatidylglycerol lysyltransferase
MTALAVHAPRARAFELLRRYGRDTVSFQCLEGGFRYFFDGDDAVVGFVDTGGAWVAAGGPVAPAARMTEVAARFADAAMAQARRACFFAAEQPMASAGLPALLVGEQPVWQASRWAAVLQGAASLRYQISRARNKGVSVRRVTGDELRSSAELRTEIERITRAWQASHALPPMQFLVQLEPFAAPEASVLLVAEHLGRVIALASAIPVYARGRMFLEDLVRDPEAPNGTAELLVDHMMHEAQHAGWNEVTLGLAPLAGDVTRWLRFARWLGGSLYDFDGLRVFKAKLRPHAWEPVYLCSSHGGSRLVALRDSLRAFAGGSLAGFALRSLARRR